MAELENNTITTAIENIRSIMTNTSLEDSFFEMILQRLACFGYIYQETDNWALVFSIQNVENFIKNNCNTLSIPNGLLNIAVDRICGEFLFGKKQSGQLNEVFDIDSAIKQIEEGDISITFNIEDTKEARIDKLLNYLKNLGQGEFACYRKMKW